MTKPISYKGQRKCKRLNEFEGNELQPKQKEDKQIQYIRIHQGNCLELMKTIPDRCIDLVVTDPPYIIKYKTNRRKDKSHQFCSEIKGDDDEGLIKGYIKGLHRIMKDNTAGYMFCSFDKVDFFKQELEKYFKVKNMIIWVKNNHTAGDLQAQFGKQYEILFLFNKGRCKFNGKRLTDVWYFDRIAGKKQLHQNEKPLELIKQCILKHSLEGNIVFDGFAGSGTTAVAAKQLNRHFIGFELIEDYVNITKERLKQEDDTNEPNRDGKHDEKRV